MVSLLRRNTDDGHPSAANGEVLSRRDAAQMLGLLGIGASATAALINSSGAARGAGTEQISHSIDVRDFIRDPADLSTHQAGFEQAVAAALASGGNEIVVPAGDWYVDGLVIPKQAPLKIRGQNCSVYSQQSNQTLTTGTRLHRTRDLPVIIGIGGNPPTVTDRITDNNANPPEIDFLNVVQALVVEDITIRNDNPTATAPLVDLRGAGGCRFDRVCLFDGHYAAGLLDLTATQDSNFMSCYFLGGTVGVRIRSGDDPYFACNALWFIACDVEDYAETGVEIGGNAVANDVPRLLHFTDHKQESKRTTGSHFVIREGGPIMFSNSYISHYSTTGPILDLQKGNGIYGQVGFTQIFTAGWQTPSCCVNIQPEVNFVDLDVRVHSGPDRDVNVATQALPANETVHIRINGLSQKINGATRAYRWDRTASVFQESDSSSACQYVFAKSGLHHWSIGNPSSPSPELQQMEIRVADKQGNAGTAMVITSTGHASESQKEVRVPGGVIAEYVQVKGHPVGLRVNAPASPGEAGEPGMWAADENWLYVVTSPNSWRRVALGDW